MSSSPVEVFGPRLFESVSYPRDKNALLDRAIEPGLPSAIQEAIRRVPAKIFRSRDELVVAVENISSQST
ncbi:MAG TPA: hypothetical protein VIJ34_05470 [Acidimicrobiales bacterium]